MSIDWQGSAAATAAVGQALFLFARLFVVALRTHGFEDAFLVQRLLQAAQGAVNAFATAYFYFTGFLCHF